ncbi:unnamed protein product [Blepharisma stoltei]|uniref:Ubiquitin-like domain-containing protein n=1 Tax=Blepharisma stoltei TaxID=1481888 RepID=A0AAU9J6A0_9CILI|nr:unnamed protein product [Blepharisma stoltei]
MKVHVLDSQKNNYDIEIGENASIQDFKNLFYEKYNQNIQNCKLLYKGRELKGDRDLSSYSIEEGSKIMLMVARLNKPVDTEIIAPPKIDQPIRPIEKNLPAETPKISSNVSQSLQQRDQLDIDPIISQALNEFTRNSKNNNTIITIVKDKKLFTKMIKKLKDSDDLSWIFFEQFKPKIIQACKNAIKYLPPKDQEEINEYKNKRREEKEKMKEISQNDMGRGLGMGGFGDFGLDGFGFGGMGGFGAMGGMGGFGRMGMSGMGGMGGMGKMGGGREEEK